MVPAQSHKLVYVGSIPTLATTFFGIIVNNKILTISI